MLKVFLKLKKTQFLKPKESAIQNIRTELINQIKHFEDSEKLVEAQRIKQRTNYDLDMIQEMGYCKGIENYSRHLSQRQAGDPPGVLLDFLDFYWHRLDL